MTSAAKSADNLSMRNYLLGALSIEYDSRKVKEGAVFFALPGLHVQGNSFIPDAISRGACAVVYQDEMGEREEAAKNAAGEKCFFLKVPDVRKEMAEAAAEFYGEPSKKLIVIGVTGTEGKSSTVSFIWQLLHLSSKKAGYFSTVSYSYGNEEEKNPEHQTTPEATTVQLHLANMVKNGCEYAVVEASSHGLSEKTARLCGVAFDVSLFMNVKHEHMEFHKTFECYRDDKANLFRALEKNSHEKLISGAKRTVPSFGLVFSDDSSASYMKNCTKKECFSFGTNDEADYKIFNIKEEKESLSFLVRTLEGEESEVRLPFSGVFNAYNVTAALAAVSRLINVPFKEAAVKTVSLHSVLGRFMHIKAGQPFEVIIDYAHTPSSFMTIFPPLRSRISGKIIAVFGSAGERDTKKRAMQGETAAKYSDYLYLTDEDPRGEEPLAILREIARGAMKAGKKIDEEIFLIPDRKKAIRAALKKAKERDAVLFLGKSHENSIIYADFVMKYDEVAQVKSALIEMGYKEEK